MKKIIKTLSILAVALSGASAQAENLNEKDKAVYLHLGGFSKHFESRRSNGRDYNEVHNNIGIEFEDKFEMLDNYFENSSWLKGDYYYSVVINYMDNSVDENSTMFGGAIKKRWNLDWEENWKFSLGGVFGFQNGYPKAGKRDADEYVPVALPLLELSYKQFGLYGTCLPEVYASGFCFVGFKYKAFEF